MGFNHTGETVIDEQSGHGPPLMRQNASGSQRSGEILVDLFLADAHALIVCNHGAASQWLIPGM